MAAGIAVDRPRAPAVTIRPIAAGDAGRLERFYAGLSDASRALRFLGWTPGLGDATCRAFCSADHEHREGFVAVLRESGPGHPAGDVVGHLCLEPDDGDSAEMAIAVADDLQGLGIGRQLLLAGVDWGRRHGLRRLAATAYAWNGRVIRLIQGLGLPVRWDEDCGIVELSIDLGATLPAAA